ncbi:MAG: hypothetical protein ACR2F8_01265 [Caulobacteraceae bacterium]
MADRIDPMVFDGSKGLTTDAARDQRSAFREFYESVSYGGNVRPRAGARRRR